MGSKRLYVCSACGREVYLTEEEKNQMGLVLCPACAAKQQAPAGPTTAKKSQTAKEILLFAGRNADADKDTGYDDDDDYDDDYDYDEDDDDDDDDYDGYDDEDGAGENEYEDTRSASGRGDGESKDLLNTLVIKGVGFIADWLAERGTDAWEEVGYLYDAYKSGRLKRYSKKIGLYKLTLNNRVMYVGRAVEYNNGGLRKRLSDYCRPNGSARKHPSGQKIHENRKDLRLSLLVLGEDENAVQKTIELEKHFIKKLSPPWNEKLKPNK